MIAAVFHDPEHAPMKYNINPSRLWLHIRPEHTTGIDSRASTTPELACLLNSVCFRLSLLL